MNEALNARQLLRDAARWFDAPELGLAKSARVAWQKGFVSGGEWMRMALGHLRDGVLPGNRKANFTRLGCLKYGLASAAMLPAMALAIWTQHWPWLCGFSCPARVGSGAAPVSSKPKAHPPRGRHMARDEDGDADSSDNAVRWFCRARIRTVVVPGLPGDFNLVRTIAPAEVGC
jgi:hypothetical protein